MSDGAEFEEILFLEIVKDEVTYPRDDAAAHFDIPLQLSTCASHGAVPIYRPISLCSLQFRADRTRRSRVAFEGNSQSGRLRRRFA